MKRLAGLIIGLTAVFFLAGTALASEGETNLAPVNVNGPACKAFSVFTDNRYQLMLTCRNLITPYSAEITRYILWVYNSEQKRWLSLGRINQGKLVTSVNFKFEQLQVTAEEGSPREPSDRIVAQGLVQPFNFDAKTAPVITATPTPTPTSGIGAVISPTPTQGKSVIGNIVGSIAKLLVIGFAVLLIGVVVLTFITRRREL